MHRERPPSGGRVDEAPDRVGRCRPSGGAGSGGLYFSLGVSGPTTRGPEDSEKRTRRFKTCVGPTQKTPTPAIEKCRRLCYLGPVTALDRLPDLLKALNAERVEYVLFGGQAVNLHGILRFTDDIDLFVSPAPENVERLRRALRRVWADPSIDEIRAEDLAGEYAVVRSGTPDYFYVDLSRLGDAYAFADIESEWIDRGDIRARVATARMLYRMKKNTLRPLDRADAVDLQAKFHLEDE
jgi:hypothetical protein